jgi:uncharacterized caspase-like protein
MKRKTRCLVHLSLCLMLLAIFFPGITTAASERRTALVIGNSAYSIGPLKNPVNDAAAISAQLQKLGFTVILKMDANLRVMEDALTDFGDRLKQGGVGLFYYAGHGLQVGGVNYLVPVEARISRESDIRHETLELGKVINEMAKTNNGLNIVILDACRDNPYYPGFRNVARGLSGVSKVPVEMFIAYSKWTNRMVKDEDVDGENSPYTKALLENITKPGLTINKVFMNVRSKVMKETGQMPWELSSLGRDFFFVPGSPERLAATIPPVKATYDLDEANRELEEEQRRLAEERASFAKKKALEVNRQIITEERERLMAEQYRARQAEARRLETAKASLEEERQKIAEESKRLAAEEREKAKKSTILAMAKRPSQPTVRETARDGRFIAYRDGTVLDTSTNLMWAAKDNGRDIRWANAKSYCENYHGGGHKDWRMPTQDELAGLYDKDKAYRSMCGDVNLTKLIRLTCGAPWASETRGSDAALFYFFYGSRSWVRQSYDRSARALPVRSYK